jgi:aldehyde:ferredoxin oxidoreductase
VPARTEALGRANKLVFAPGILAGSIAPNSGRLSVGAKSPLTNTIKEANAGGAAGQKLARLGIQAIVIEGASPQLCAVKVSSSSVTFIAADHLKGTGNYETIEKLKAEYGDGVAIISIGLAGERCLKAASVSVTSPDFQIRMASRGGLGAVMGAKNLKAVIIDDEGSPGVEAADAVALKEAAGHLTKGIVAHPFIQGLKRMGTPLLVMVANGITCLPTKNYSMGKFEEAEKISGESMMETMTKRPNSKAGHRCMNGCVISCSNIYTDEQGQPIVSGLEYETLGMMGSNCMINDLDDIARLNRLCNDFGLDTIETGAAIAVAMEGGLIPWGDGKAACALLEEVVTGTDKGVMIGNGCLETGLKLGVQRIPHVKGQSLPAWEPRALKGTGVTYATSPMGADHTCGNALPNPANPQYNPAAPTGQAPVSRFLQQYVAAVDTLGICLFAAVPLLGVPGMVGHIISCATAMTSQAFDVEYMMKLGASVLRSEKQFNEEAGFTSKDDRLPEFFSKERLLPSGLVFDVPESDLDEALKF